MKFLNISNSNAIHIIDNIYLYDIQIIAGPKKEIGNKLAMTWATLTGLNTCVGSQQKKKKWFFASLS